GMGNLGPGVGVEARPRVFSNGRKPTGPDTSRPPSASQNPEMDAPLLAGLPGDVQALLASPPLTEPMLLELSARWEGLSLTPALARMADALRLFVVTWDPIEWLVPRPEAVATANAWPLAIGIY